MIFEDWHHIIDYRVGQHVTLHGQPAEIVAVSDTDARVRIPGGERTVSFSDID